MKRASLLEEINRLSRELTAANRHVVDQHPASGMASPSMNSVRGKYKADLPLEEITAEFWFNHKLSARVTTT
jgi:hypothetical protein